MENKLKCFLSLFVVLAMVFSMVSANALAAEGETAVVTEKTADLTISTVEQLQAFAADVNNGNSYEGKTVVLANEIDMMDEDGIISAMTPIGTVDSPFKGTFDGQGYGILNLYITYFEGESREFCPTLALASLA